MDHDEALTKAIADLREAARYCRKNPPEAVQQSQSIVVDIHAVPGGMGMRGLPRMLVLGRLIDNIEAGCRLAVSCPDLLEGYLLGAADELEALLGKPATAERAAEIRADIETEACRGAGNGVLKPGIVSAMWLLLEGIAIDLNRDGDVDRTDLLVRIKNVLDGK